MAEGTIRLDDGRALGFVTWGPQRGTPVLYFHGAAGSPLDRCDVADALLARWGVRWIVVHRPGFGASDRLAHRTLAGWGDDVAQLADALALERLRIVGVSAGGPYALAAAAALGSRVAAIAAVSSLGPPRRRDLGARLCAATARRAPWALEAGALAAARAYCAHRDLALWTRRGASAFVDDLVPVLADWRLDLAKVGADVTLWHGERDRIVPIAHAVGLAARLPAARLVPCGDEGHFFFRRRLGGIVGALLAAGGDAPLHDDPPRALARGVRAQVDAQRERVA